MELLVAFRDDPAGHNMAKFISKNMDGNNEFFHSENFDLLIIDTPSISADWLEEKFNYDGFVFLSKHAAESGKLALTCHSTGNFSTAEFGGNPGQIAIPHPQMQKSYMKNLWSEKDHFSEFQITIEATHHGPTALNKPTMFIEIGTTDNEWKNVGLCDSVAEIVIKTMNQKKTNHPVAICIGGTHYPEKFTNELIHGEFALGTVIPKHALDYLDDKLFSHILERNQQVSTALIDWNGLGKNKQKIIDLLSKNNIEMRKF
jgi:D-aminoacyl-tRNA deacylase